ncbi:DUF2207 domain-containing protein [Candidatus Dependentiae bacterium]|nr:MAG: DUF2207 domain-containing protein [Candidatus Dependentiae bacterium]
MAMLFFILGLLLAAPQGAQAVERISSFNSDITIHQDASMTVKETIDVVSEGQTIRHGIVREFPTWYKDRHGNNYAVRFHIKKILFDGKEAPYHIRDASNGKLIYIGDKGVYVPRGTHTFVIEYETSRQLGFFKKYDELYWNVTGTGWRLPIDQATAKVHLPAGVPELQIHVEGYTGYQGSKGQNYTAQVDDGVPVFKTIWPLASRQGLTIVVTWPKGFVHQPTQWQEWKWFFWDNKHIAVGLLGLLVLLFFYLFVWIRFRRSQDLGTVIPLFYPPENLSPGLMRYFISMGYDAKVLAADIVNMAVMGFLSIHYETKLFFSGAYRLEKKKRPYGMFEELYKGIDSNLFGSSDSIQLSEKNKEQINKTISVLSKAYKRETKSWFGATAHYTIIGGIIFILFCFVPFVGYGVSENIEFKGVFIFFKLIVIPVIILLYFFKWLLQGYTPEGLEIKKQIEGFRLFLKTTEEERLKIIGTPPTKTPELYETYLPYAIALGVEKQWSRQFAPLFEQMRQAGNPYIVVWISGGSFDSFNADTFVSTISSSMGSSISSSSTPPGSSSGFGGRGSSGGGGGGGGGGGW